MSCGFLLFWGEPWLCSLPEKYYFLWRVCKCIKKTNSRHSGLKTTLSQCWSPHSSVHSLRSQGRYAWISSKFKACHIKICRGFGCFVLKSEMLCSFQTFILTLLNCVPGYRHGNLSRKSSEGERTTFASRGALMVSPPPGPLQQALLVYFCGIWVLLKSKRWYYMKQSSKVQLLCWLSFFLRSTLDSIAPCVCTVVWFVLRAMRVCLHSDCV